MFTSVTHVDVKTQGTQTGAIPHIDPNNISDLNKHVTMKKFDLTPNTNCCVQHSNSDPVN